MNESIRYNRLTLYLIPLIVFLSQPVLSQETAPEEESRQDTEASEFTDSQSGYEDIAEFDGHAERMWLRVKRRIATE